jgi:hypothetical protein
MNFPNAPRRTTPNFGFSMVNRSLTDGLSRRKFGKAEMREIAKYFFNDGPIECVYCGDSNVRRWDHLVPVTEGGEAVLGNMVPACSRCDDSKGASFFKDWMKGSAPYSPTTRKIDGVRRKMNQIERYAASFDYVATSVESRLTKREAAELRRVRKQLTEVSNEAQALIAGYAKRTGNS